MWEKVSGGQNDHASLDSDRLKVFGGWIVRTTGFTGTTSGGVGIAQTFVPDPKHEWVLDKEKI